MGREWLLVQVKRKSKTKRNLRTETPTRHKMAEIYKLGKQKKNEDTNKRKARERGNSLTGMLRRIILRLASA